MHTYQNSIYKALLMPMFLSAKNRLLPSRAKSFKIMGTIVFCLIICILIYSATLSVLNYFHAQDELGR